MVLKWQVFEIGCGFLFLDLKSERDDLGCLVEMIQHHKTDFPILDYLL